jgi:hypothetical protein
MTEMKGKKKQIKNKNSCLLFFVYFWLLLLNIERVLYAFLKKEVQ